MGVPVISVENKEISYNEKADYSLKEISKGTTISSVITFGLGL